MLRPLTAEDHIRGIRKQELGCPLCRNKFAARDVLKLHVDLRAFIGAQLIGSSSYIEEQLLKQQSLPITVSTSCTSSFESTSSSTVNVEGTENYRNLKLNHARSERELAIMKRKHENLETEYQSLENQLEDERAKVVQTESSITHLHQQFRNITSFYERSEHDKQHLQQLVSTIQKELASTMKERDILRERNRVTKQEYETVRNECETKLKEFETIVHRSIEKEKQTLNNNLDLQTKCRTLESERNRLDHLCQRQDKQLKQLRNNQNTLPASLSTASTTPILPPNDKQQQSSGNNHDPHPSKQTTAESINNHSLSRNGTLGSFINSMHRMENHDEKASRSIENTTAVAASMVRSLSSASTSSSTLLSTKGTSINPFFKSSGTLKTTDQHLKDILQSPVDTSPVFANNVPLSTSLSDSTTKKEIREDEVINLLFDDDDENEDSNEDTAQTNQSTSITKNKALLGESTKTLFQRTESTKAIGNTSVTYNEESHRGKRKALHGLTGEINKKAHSLSTNTVSSSSSSTGNLGRNGQQMSIMDGVKALQHQANENKKYWGSL